MNVLNNYFTIDSILLLCTTIGSILLTLCTYGDIWKPLSIIVILGLISAFFIDKEKFFSIGLITWGLFGYVCGILYMLDYHLVSSILLTIIISLSFWTKRENLSMYSTLRIMSFAVTFLPTLLVK